MTTLAKTHTHRASWLSAIAAAALLSAVSAGPVFAQAAIQEPGLFAFYHPNLDVLNGGAPTPAANGYRDHPPVVLSAGRSTHHRHAAH